jgi:MFS family permease
MSGWLVRTLLLALCTMVPVQALRPLVSYRALELGASAVDLGIVAGSFALLSFLFAAPLGRWVDRLGEPRFLLGGTSLISATAVALSFANSLPALVVAQALLGLGQVATLVGLQTLVANGAGRAGRDGRFGAFTVVGSLAQMIGPTVSGFLYGSTDLQLSAIFLLGGVINLLAIGLAVTLLLRPPATHINRADEERAPQEPFFRAVGSVMRQPAVPHAMLASVTVLTSIDLLIAYLPAYGEANGIPAGTIGLMLGVRAAGGLFSRVLMLQLLRLASRRRLLVQNMLLTTVAMLLLPLTTSPPILIGLLAVAGFGLGLGQPLSMAWIADQVPREIRGTALGVRITGNRVGQLVVPLVVGVIAGAAGIGAIFVASGTMLGLSSMWVARAPTSGPTRGQAPAA